MNSDPLVSNQSDHTLAGVWDTLHRIQADFCFAQELGVYYTAPGWLRARRVLDVGTGHGHYLARLASVFPDKHYVGVDIEPSYVELARRRCHADNVSFVVDDLYDMRGQYDFVLMRLIMQHLDRPGAALDKLAELLRPGGCALVIDALDSARFFHPWPDTFMQFFEDYCEHQRAKGLDRDIAAKLGAMLRGHPQLRQERVDRLVIPSTVAGNLELFEKTYYLVIVMVELAGEMHADFAAVKQAWRRWCAQERRYMQVGLRLVRVRRRTR